MNAAFELTRPHNAVQKFSVVHISSHPVELGHSPLFTNGNARAAHCLNPRADFLSCAQQVVHAQKAGSRVALTFIN